MKNEVWTGVISPDHQERCGQGNTLDVSLAGESEELLNIGAPDKPTKVE